VSVTGYTRRSKGEDDALGLLAQERAIRAAYPDAHVVQEVASGGRADNREVLQLVLAELRRGDTLVVTKLSRLCRNLLDFAGILEDAKRRGWVLVVLEEGFNLGTANGRAMAGILAVFAQWEREVMGERIKEALAEKRAGGWDPRTVPAERHAAVRRLHRRGLSQRAIAGRLGLHKEQVARCLRERGER
jgi:DNA invertase Pin-like site-specific DNA recombinase